MITHTAFDWLFRHALLSIKTSTSFLKGSNRGIANNKYAVRRALLKLNQPMGETISKLKEGCTPFNLLDKIHSDPFLFICVKQKPIIQRL